MNGAISPHSDERGEEGPMDLAGAVATVTAAGLAVGRGGLAAPGVAVLALAAESDRTVGDSTALALATPLLGKNDGESEIVHPNHLLHSAPLRIVRMGASAPVWERVRQGVRTQ
jgi:hypothetical protein